MIKEKKNESMLLNYYDVDYSPGYINFVGINEHIYPGIYPIFMLNPEIQQISGENKINIQMNSLGYVFYPDIIKYYIIINIEYDIDLFYQIITGQKKLNSNNHEFCAIIEDDGSKEKFETNIEIDIELNEDYPYNTIYFIPIRKKTEIVEILYETSKEFKYKNISRKNKKIFLAIFISVIVLIIIIVISVILCKLKNKRKKRENLIEENSANIEGDINIP